MNYPNLELSASKLWLISFYREQLSKFKQIGLGRKTEFGVVVTDELIASTEKRLAELTVVYERNVSPFAFYQRKYAKQKRREKKLNGDFNGSTNRT